MAFPYPIVSTDWLAGRLTDADLIILDGSWRMPGATVPAREDYQSRHIPGAVFFDIDAIARQNTCLQHMLPSPATFSANVSAMGVGNETPVIVYDDAGLFSAARVWWTFRAMGHEKISVLDGGLPKWDAENRPVTNSVTLCREAEYVPRARAALDRSADDVRQSLDRRDAVILDARPKARFEGVAPEPRAGLRSGAMPGAVNIPAGEILTAARTLKPLDTLVQLFAQHGVTHKTDVITTCGSGVTAAMLSLALESIGHRNHALYDGSWAEWGRDDNDPLEFPVSTGERRRETKG